MSQRVSVSIIVPIYNAESYLHRCVDSILAQTLTSIEIILVDDGSADGSAEICDDYATRYPDTIRVIHKQNGGLTAAWKSGCEIASGVYIGFVDADDYIDKDMYETLYNRALIDNSDMVCCGLKHVYEGGIHREWYEEMQLPYDLIDLEKDAAEVFPILINNGAFMGRGLLPCRVVKIVRREIVADNIDMCDNKVSIGEDMQFSLCTFLDSKRVSIEKGYYPYTYYMNSSSMTIPYDTEYMKKIGIMRDNLLRISNVKGKYDFTTQIINDYLCLTILHIKGGIYKKKSEPYRNHHADMLLVRNNSFVQEALDMYDMPKLTFFEKLFIWMLRNRIFIGIYVAIRIYFR